MALERLKDYIDGYIYGVGNILHGLAIGKLIKKEYAKHILSGKVKALSEDPDHKPYICNIRNSYQNMTADIACKELDQ